VSTKTRPLGIVSISCIFLRVLVIGCAETKI